MEEGQEKASEWGSSPRRCPDYSALQKETAGSSQSSWYASALTSCVRLHYPHVVFCRKADSWSTNALQYEKLIKNLKKKIVNEPEDKPSRKKQKWHGSLDEIKV
jgi:hypothetical protein